MVRVRFDVAAGGRATQLSFLIFSQLNDIERDINLNSYQIKSNKPVSSHEVRDSRRHAKDRNAFG